MSVPEASSNVAAGVPAADRGPAGSGGQSGVAAAAGTAKEQAAELGGTAKEQAKAVAGEATQQAKSTADEARRQARQLAGRTRDELLVQVDDKTGQAATGLQTVAGQLAAVAEGRTTDAGPFAGYAQQAADRVGSIAERLQSGGAQGALDDITGFARRRPGLFLVGALGAGFLAGRLVRSGKAAMDEQDGADGASSPSTTPTPALRPPTSAAAFDVPPVATTTLAGAVPTTTLAGAPTVGTELP